jgi:hypothetical protein
MSKQPALGTLLDERVLTSAKLITSLLKDSGVSTEWLDSLPADWSEEFNKNSSEVLPDFISSVLGTAGHAASGCGVMSEENETWHSIPKEDGSPTGLYVVLTQDSATEFVIGLGGVSESLQIGVDLNLKLSGKIPVAKVSGSGWDLLFGKNSCPYPYSFGLCLQADAGKNILQDNDPGVWLGGVNLSVTLLNGTVGIDLVLTQLKLPGEITPRDRTLDELADSFNLSFMLNMLLDNLSDAQFGLALRDLLGLGSGDFPGIDWDGLVRGEDSFSKWFLELKSQNKIAEWLARFRALTGVGSQNGAGDYIEIEGAGTRPDPYRVPFGNSGLQLTLALEGDAAQVVVYPGIMMDFDPFIAGTLKLQGSVRGEVAGIHLHTGLITPLPTLVLDLKLSRESGSLLPQTSLTFDQASLAVEVESAAGGLMYTHGQGLNGYLEFYNVDIDTRHWDVMDVNSMGEGLDAVAGDARVFLLKTLQEHLGLRNDGSPFASRIGALLGLNAPLSAASVGHEWPVDLVVQGDYLISLLEDPLPAIAWYHSRAMHTTLDPGTAYHYLMQDLWHLLFGESCVLEGLGTSDSPWKKVIVSSGGADSLKTVQLEIIGAGSEKNPLLRVDFHAVVFQELSSSLFLNADMKVSLMDLTLPDVATGQSGTSAVWLADAALDVSLKDLPALTMGSLTIDGESLTCSCTWSQLHGFDYDIGLHNLQIAYRQGNSDLSIPWPDLHLPKLQLAGDDSDWSSPGFNLGELGPVILKLYGQWLSHSSAKGFGLAGLLGLLPDLTGFVLPHIEADLDYTDWTWDKSPWALPADWPTLSFSDWSLLLSDPWVVVKRHLARLFSKPDWAIPALRWLGGVLTDCLPDLSLPEFHWEYGRNDSGRKQMPQLSDLPFVITGHGTYPDPWKLKLKKGIASEWQKGAFLVWLDPDGPPQFSQQSMIYAVAPHLSRLGLSHVADVLDHIGLDEMLDLVGLLGGVNEEIACLCKGFDENLAGHLLDLQDWLKQSDGYVRLSDPTVEIEAYRHISNTKVLDTVKVADHSTQLAAFASEIQSFISSQVHDADCHYVLVGDEQTEATQWSELLTTLGIDAAQCQNHNFCRFGVAPDQQALDLAVTGSATVVTLTSLNTESGQPVWLQMDDIVANSPARQLQRILDVLQSTQAGKKVVVISHGMAGFAVQVVLNGLSSAERQARFAGVCTVGMPAVPTGAADFPGVISETALQGLDFIQGLLKNSVPGPDAVLTSGLSVLDQCNSPACYCGYDDRVKPELLPVMTAGLFTKLTGLADYFPEIPCVGFVSRLAASGTDKIEDFSIKSLLMSWLTAQFNIMPQGWQTPTHVGFGVSWEDEHLDHGLLIQTQVRQDLFRMAFSGAGEEGLQPLPRTRFGIEVHRPSGWLVGGRKHLIRCRWLEFGFDVFPGSCEPSLVFHDAGVNQAVLQRLSLDWVEGLLWTAENQVRILLDQFCEQLPEAVPDIGVSPALSCFFEGTGLFYRYNGKLLPHTDSWQALLRDPSGFIRLSFQNGMADTTKKNQLLCAFRGLFSLGDLPVIRQFFEFVEQCDSSPEARMVLLVMQAVELVRLEGDTCFPVLVNWGKFLQHPCNYIVSAWDKFTENTDVAQAKRALFAAQFSVEYGKFAGEAQAPVWLHDLAFDGNRITFTLGGDGFVLMKPLSQSVAGVQLCIPVELDLINHHIRVRYEVDVSGVLGCAAPLVTGSVFGGASFFVEIFATTGTTPQVLYSYGLQFGGGVEFVLSAPDQWELALRRLLTQGLSSRFLAEMRRQLQNTVFNDFIACFVGADSRQGLLLPGGTADWHHYLSADQIRCLLNRLGDLLGVCDADSPNTWLLSAFQFCYPDRQADLQLFFGTAAPLGLYKSAGDYVLFAANAGLLFPETGAVTCSAELDISTSFSGVDVGVETGYVSAAGACCRLNIGGVGVPTVRLDLFPFGGFDPLLHAVGQHLLDQCLPRVFTELEQQCSQHATCRKLCVLARMVCVDLEVLQSDPMGWLQQRLDNSDVFSALVDLWPATGHLVWSSGNNWGLTYTLGTELQIMLGKNVCSGHLCPGLEWGIRVLLTPPVQDVVSFDFDLCYWADAENTHCWFDLSAALKEDVLVLAGVSIQPRLSFTYDSANTDLFGLKLQIPRQGSSAPYLVTLTVLPELGLTLDASPEQLIEPLFHAVIELVSVQQWLKTYTVCGKKIGWLFVQLQLLQGSDETSYSLNPDAGTVWASAEDILQNLLQVLLKSCAGQPLYSFDTGGVIAIVEDQGWYGVRLSHPGISLAADPEISLVLGGGENWINDKCGLHNSNTAIVHDSDGLTFFLVQQNGNQLEPGCRILLSDVGLNCHGKGNDVLFDVAGCTVKGVNLHGYLDMIFADSSSSSSLPEWAVLLEAEDFGFPFGNAAGGDNPVANSLLASDQADMEPVNPGFDLKLSYGKELYASVGDSDAPDGVAWVEIGKQFGPVYIKSLGICLEGTKLAILVDGKVEMMGLVVEVDDLSLTMNLADPFDTSQWAVDCKGLGVSYNESGLVISGALLKVEKMISGKVQISYDGVCVIETSGTGFAALGSYTQLGSDPSMFVFIVINTTLGGPPMFFVRGLAGGFGYNRDLHVPPVEEVDTFPLVEIATADQLADPLDLIKKMGEGNFFPPVRGSYWFGVGVKFTTFEIFKSFGMLYVLLNRGLEIGMLGCTKLEMPEQNPLVHVVMNFKALFSTGKGIMLAQAQLTNDSWLFDPNCRLQGGFAVASWFAGPHKGDFVITLGGYHHAYKKPSHYPDVPRLGFNWQVSASTTIKGEAYFALTSNAVMAGGQLDASYKDGALEAWFKVWAHFLIQWKPFFYDISFGVSIGASYRVSVKIPWVGRISKTFKVELGGDVHIWGPEFAGTATLNWWVISFTVRFGAKSSSPDKKPLDWTDFQREFLPVENGQKKYYQIHAEKGLIAEQDGVWLMKSECILRTETVLPITKTGIGTSNPDPILDLSNSLSHIDIRPMALSGVQSVHLFDIVNSGNKSIFVEDTWTKQSKGLYIRSVKNADGTLKETLTRMAVRFDAQEIARALWKYDQKIDPADTSVMRGDMGMSVRFYIDNEAALSEIVPIAVNQNNIDPDCVLPLPFYFKVYEMQPVQTASNWMTILGTAHTMTDVVVTMYSETWQALRESSVEAMCKAGASLMPASDMTSSRVHHLLGRKAMPQVVTLYEGLGKPAEAQDWSVSESSDPPSWLALGWSLHVMTLPVRTITRQAVIHTSVDEISGSADLPRVNLDRFSGQRRTAGKGRVLKVDHARLGSRKQKVASPRVLLARGMSGGASQKVLAEQFYKGLDSSEQGAILKAGMVHLWTSAEQVGKNTSINITGPQATRICCFDGGGSLLLEEETVGSISHVLPERTRLAVLVGLGDSGGLTVQPAAGAVSLRRSARGQSLCGWSSGDLLPQVNLNTLLARGAVLQSTELSARDVEPSFITPAEFLHRRSSCVTWFAGTVACVGILLSCKGSLELLDKDVDIQFSRGFKVKPGQIVKYENSLLCLYDVQVKDVEKPPSWLAVTVQGRNGWMLGGVCAGRRDMAFWENHFNLDRPPKPSQEIVSSGEYSEVSIVQDDLAERLEFHRKFVQEKADKRAEYVRKWKKVNV